MLNCKETSELLSRSMEERLPFRTRLSLRLHLMMCGLCRRFEKQLSWLRKATTRFRTDLEKEAEEGAAELSPTAAARIEQAMLDEAQAGMIPADEGPMA